MQLQIDLKHVGPKAQVQQLLGELSKRLGQKLQHLGEDAISLRVVFEANQARGLYKTALTCHLPGRTLAVHREQRDAGLAIRRAFDELRRQIDKHASVLRAERLRRRSPHHP